MKSIMARATEYKDRLGIAFEDCRPYLRYQWFSQDSRSLHINDATEEEDEEGPLVTGSYSNTTRRKTTFQPNTSTLTHGSRKSTTSPGGF